MVLSCVQCQAALKHILENVFDLDTGSPLHMAIEQNAITSPFGLVAIKSAEYEKLVYQVNDNPTTLSLGHFNLLKAFQAYVLHTQPSSANVSDDFWISITQEDFDNFRISPVYVMGIQTPETSTTLTEYSWNFITIAEVSAQDVNDVFNKSTSTDGEILYNTSSFDIKNNMESIETYTINSHLDPYLSSNQWHKLLDDIKKMCNCVSLKSKAILFQPKLQTTSFLTNSNSSYYYPPCLPLTTPPPYHHAYIHGIETMIACLHALCGGSSPSQANWFIDSNYGELDKSTSEHEVNNHKYLILPYLIKMSRSLMILT